LLILKKSYFLGGIKYEDIVGSEKKEQNQLYIEK